MFLVHCALFNSFITYRKLTPHTDITLSKYLQTLTKEWIACDTGYNGPRNLPSTSSTAGGWTPRHDLFYRCSGDMKRRHLERIIQSREKNIVYILINVVECKVHGKHTNTSFICKSCRVPLCIVLWFIIRSKNIKFYRSTSFFKIHVMCFQINIIIANSLLFI